MKKIISAVIILIPFITKAQIANDSLVLYLPFDGDANDQSGNNYNGVINGATLTTGLNDQPNSAYYFNGINNSIVIPNISKLDKPLKAFTILIRMQPQDIYPDPTVQDPFWTTYNFLTWHRNSSDSTNAFMNSKMRTGWQPPGPGTDGDKDFMGYIMNWCSGNVGTASGYQKDTSKVNNQWLTIAYVYNSDTLRIYHNCSIENDWVNVYPEISDLCGSDPMQISLGNVPQGAFLYGYRYFKGKIDELRIYTRTLSDAEVKYFADTLCNEKIPVSVLPAIQILPNPCQPNEFRFINTSVVTGIAADSILWRISTGDSAKTGSYSYRFASTGNYTIHLWLYAADSMYTKDTMISVTSLERIKFLQTDQTNIQACEGSSVALSVSGGISYNWQPCYNLNTCSEPSVTAAIDSNIIYTVSATDINQCPDTLQIAIQKVPDENHVYVPTAFTPNHDGLNDKFGVISDVPLADLQFAIYNRWGKPVFLSKDQNKKWDGSVNSMAAAAGTYIWMLTYKNASGCMSRKLHGTIVLIK